MHNFTAHTLEIEAEALSPVYLNRQKGSALRGALFWALRGYDHPRAAWQGFCTNKAAPSCWECPLHAACPVSTLVSTLNSTSRHGRDVPRPYVIRPPLDGGKTRYGVGESMTFGLTLFANALNLFPYVVLALARLEHEGLGRKVEANGRRRGRLAVKRVVAVNQLTGERQIVQRAGDTMVQVPDVPVTHEQVLAQAVPPPGVVVTIDFVSPMRIVEDRHLLKTPHYRPIFQRLLDRLEALSGQFSDTPLAVDFSGLVAQAEGVELVEDRTGWVDLGSYSVRRRTTTPIGGLVGRAAYRAADWSPFWPWLVWGTVTHVGKSTVKGDGWYRISESASQRISESASQRVGGSARQRGNEEGDE